MRPLKILSFLKGSRINHDEIFFLLLPYKKKSVTSGKRVFLIRVLYVYTHADKTIKELLVHGVEKWCLNKKIVAITAVIRQNQLISNLFFETKYRFCSRF